MRVKGSIRVKVRVRVNVSVRLRFTVRGRRARECGHSYARERLETAAG